MPEHRGSTRTTRAYFKLNYLHSFWFECTMRKMSSKVPLLALPWQRAFLFPCSQEDCEKGQGARSLFRRGASLQPWPFSGLSVCEGILWVKLIVKSIACLYGKKLCLIKLCSVKTWVWTPSQASGIRIISKHQLRLWLRNTSNAAKDKSIAGFSKRLKYSLPTQTCASLGGCAC